MHDTILSLHTPSASAVESKGQNFFLKVVMLHIKLKEKKCTSEKVDLTHIASMSSGVGLKGHILKLCR